MELSHLHHNNDTTNVKTITTTISNLKPAHKATMDASNLDKAIYTKQTTPTICDASNSTTTTISLTNHNNVDGIVDQKTIQQLQRKDRSLITCSNVVAKYLEENKNAVVSETSTVQRVQSETESTQAVKIKRCKHGRIIIKDSTKKRSSTLIHQMQKISHDSRPLSPPVVDVSISTIKITPANSLPERPKVSSKSTLNEKPSQDCERLAEPVAPQPSPSPSPIQPLLSTESTTIYNNRLATIPPPDNIDSKSKSNNNNNDGRPAGVTNQKRHSKQNHESRGHRRRDKSSSRTSPRRCSVIRNKSHSQSPSHRKSPRRYRSTSSRERSRERRKHSNHGRRRRSPHRSSRDHLKTDARRNIKLRSPHRHLSPISPPPRHHNENLSSKRRSPLRRHSRSSGSKSMSTSRSRSRSRSRSGSRGRSRSRTRNKPSNPERKSVSNNDSSLKKDLPRESLDARIDNLFNHVSVGTEDSFSKRTSSVVVHDSSAESSTLPISPKKPPAKNDYYDLDSNSPSSDIYDPEGPISPLSSEPNQSESIVRPACNKKTYVPDKDVIPSSAVSLNQHEKYLQKKTRQERIVEEVKMALKPFYQRRAITKEQYKDVSRRAVPKICHSKNGEINPVKIRSLIHAYVKKLTHHK